jgi:quinohemoprotein ethanol dehydrogenase
VYAVDAKTGKSLWRFDPEVLLVAGKKLRAGSGVRGLAYSKGRLFVGTHDGRLIALDAKKGTALWSTPTLEANDGSFISGAPRVFNDKVAIGFGDSGSVHGAVGVYDAATGKRLWRWETGAGGGAVWNAITYDPEVNRLYVGTGNARGADAAANRFACSVVALNADSGELGLELRHRAWRPPAVRCFHRHHAGYDQHRWPASQSHIARAQRRHLSRARSRHGQAHRFKEVRPRRA